MSTQYTVGSYLLDRLKELGLRHIFGVPGDYAFPLLDCIEMSEDISWVGNCNELNASYAADGYARIHGIGAFVVTGGVGELSASCGVGGAYAEQVPVVAIAGHPSIQALNKGQSTHHSLHGGDFSAFPRIYKEFTVAQALLTPENACQEIDRVLEACWLQKLPVYIQFPLDVQALPAEAPTAKLALPEPASDPAQLAAFMESLLPLLSAAQRPAMLIDAPVGPNHLTELVESFANKSGIPFAATFGGKSACLDETQEQYLGTYRAGIESAVSQQLEAADLLLRLGIQHDETNSGCAAFDLRSPHVVDLQINSAAIGASEYPNVTLRDVLTQLNEQVPHRQFAFRSQQSLTTSVPFEPQHDTLIKQERLWQRFGHFLQENDVLIADLGTCNIATTVPMPARTRVITQWTWEAIGYTVPAVLGAHLADRSRRHLLVIGDGAFQVTAQELSTILRHELNPIILLLHNHHYEVENALRPDGFKEMHYNELQDWNYHQLPTIFAQMQKPLGLCVTTEEELETAFTQAAQAQTEGRCVLIEVMLAGNDIPPQFAKSLSLSRQPAYEQK